MISLAQELPPKSSTFRELPPEISCATHIPAENTRPSDDCYVIRRKRDLAPQYDVTDDVTAVRYTDLTNGAMGHSDPSPVATMANPDAPLEGIVLRLPECNTESCDCEHLDAGRQTYVIAMQHETDACVSAVSGVSGVSAVPFVASEMVVITSSNGETDARPKELLKIHYCDAQDAAILADRGDARRELQCNTTSTTAPRRRNAGYRNT